MLNDFVISSPSKSDKSIRETRLRRRSKRKQCDQSMLVSDHGQSAAYLHNVINELYKDSDEETPETDHELKSAASRRSAVVKTFIPFELEKSLAMADQLLPQQLKHKRNIPPNEGFTTCTSLNNLNDGNSSYIITESELLNCCQQAENVLKDAISKEQYESKSTELQRTPEKCDNIALVNSILNDFSQSPLAKDQIVTNTNWEYTPEFRLRRQPAKSYSRKFLNTTKMNLTQRFKQYSKNNSLESDDDLSSCSSLSIQEDNRFERNLNVSTIRDTSNTQHLCENLLNLTEYFTQHQSEQILLDDEQMQNTSDISSLINIEEKDLFRNIPQLIKDILRLRKIKPNTILCDSYKSADDFNGFNSTSNEIDTHLSTMTGPNSKQDLNARGSQKLSIVNNENGTIRLNDLKETKDHNLVQKHDTQMPSNAIDNVMLKPTNKDDNFIVPDISIENPATSNFIGFKTASSNAIKVSKEAHVIASKIMSNLPDIAAFYEKDPNNCDTKITNKDVNIFENLEDYEWNDDCDFLNFQTPIGLNENFVPEKYEDIPSTSKFTTPKLETVSEKDAHTPNKTQMIVQDLKNATSDIKNDDNHDGFPKVSHNNYLKTLDLQIEPIKQLHPDLGIHNAKSKNFTISVASKQNFKEPVNEICLVSQPKKTNKINIEINKEISGIQIINDKYDISKPRQGEDKGNKNNTISLPDIKNAGFQTASGRNIATSTKAQKTIGKLLEEFSDTSKDFLNDLESIKNDVNKRNNKLKIEKLKNSYINDRASEISVDTMKTITNEQQVLLEIPNLNDNGNHFIKDMGFQTAKGKQISISTNAKQMAEKLLEELKTFQGMESYENDLKELKKKIQIKNKDFMSKSHEEDNEYTNLSVNKYPSSTSACNIPNSSPKIANSKRKKSIDNDNLDSPKKTTHVKMAKVGVHASKSLFDEQSLKSPLTFAAHSVISRKNKLSLTKKRKSKINSLIAPVEGIPQRNKEIYDLNVNTTPIKACISLNTAERNPETPNLKEFFANAPLTSTPRINKQTKSPQTIEDSDLKPINWINDNNSVISNNSANNLHTTKLSDNSGLNITFNSSIPTVLERIGRLKMYGEAPAVPSIAIESNHNCRPSGLRRTRSMQKKTEN